MAETDKKIEAMEQEVSEASVNPQADAPKKGAVAAEPTHVKNDARSEEHTSELQSPCNLVCRLLLEKKKTRQKKDSTII